jgi:hypothetical protein
MDCAFFSSENIFDSNTQPRCGLCDFDVLIVALWAVALPVSTLTRASWSFSERLLTEFQLLFLTAKLRCRAGVKKIAQCKEGLCSERLQQSAPRLARQVERELTA